MLAFLFSFVLFSFLFESVQPELASRLRCLPAVFLLVVMLYWSKLAAGLGSVADNPNNRLAKSLIQERACCCLIHSSQGAMVVKVKHGRSRWQELVDRVRAYSRWLSWRRRWRLHQRLKAGRRHHAIVFSGRRAAISFLPAMMPVGEAVLLPTVRHGLLLWQPRHAKWFRPRRRWGGVRSVAVDPIAFCSSVRGPFCHVQGLGCNLQFSKGPVCNMSCFLSI